MSEEILTKEEVYQQWLKHSHEKAITDTETAIRNRDEQIEYHKKCLLREETSREKLILLLVSLEEKIKKDNL